MGKSGAHFDLLASNAESLLWPSLRANSASAWHGHVSFAHWLVSAQKPRVVVELGTHNGVSFAAFCNAAKRSAHDCICYAVDTWQGDEHAGLYGEQVYDDLLEFVTKAFGDHAVLKRSLFEEARDDFEDGCVDLLHIDGLHTYEAVRKDFETWQSKLSSRAVVLFHDTCVYERDFGVSLFWDEITKKFKGFNFEHSYGLGVLAFGEDVPACVADLVDLEPSRQVMARSLFAQASALAETAGLGAGISRAESSIPSGLINIAPGCVFAQSSCYNEVPPHAFLSTIRDGTYGFHTDLEENPWVIVDFGRIRTLQHLVVYNRLAPICKPRSRRLIASLSDDGLGWVRVYEHHGAPFGGIDGEPLHVDLQGKQARFLRLHLAERTFFHLDQIGVYASADAS